MQKKTYYVRSATKCECKRYAHWSFVWKTYIFRDYLCAFLSNAYLDTKSEVRVLYYGQEHFFTLVLSNELRLEQLSISDLTTSSVIYKVAFKCLFSIVDAEDYVGPPVKNPFDKFGGAKNVKLDIERYVITRRRRWVYFLCYCYE